MILLKLKINQENVNIDSVSEQICTDISKKMIYHKGITLIALVITIIILLILAGVTINLTLGENSIFKIAQQAVEKTNESSAKELLNIKIFDYQTYVTNQNKIATLEGLKEYLKNDKEIEYIDLYIRKEDLKQVEEGEIATHAKIKLKRYIYEFILDSNLEIIQLGDGETGKNENNENQNQIHEVKIDSVLENLLKEANMTITLEDILNTPEIMNNVNGLIPKLTESDVTRNEDSGIITYTDNKGGVIRSNSEASKNYYSYYAFDEVDSSSTCSETGKANGYFLEYEFPQKCIVFQAKFKLTNGSTYNGQRIVVIQGYDEDINEWKDLTKDLLYEGNKNTFKEETQDLNYSKAYKRYRLYVKSLGNSTGNGSHNSGLYKMQLYGVLNSDVKEDFSNEVLKKLLLSNSSIDTITLEQMITNADFTKSLIDALSVETVTNNKTLMSNLQALIPKLTESDVIRSEDSGIITYTDNKGGVIRSNSEASKNYYSYYAFDEVDSSSTCSETGKANGYFLEYEFPQKYIVFQAKFKLTNGSTYNGQRIVVIQGYDEDINEWKDLTKDLLCEGNKNTFKEETVDLNYSKAYKRYRLYVKSLGNSTGNGSHNSGLYKMQLYGKLAN